VVIIEWLMKHPFEEKVAKSGPDRYACRQPDIEGHEDHDQPQAICDLHDLKQALQQVPRVEHPTPATNDSDRLGTWYVLSG